MYHYEYVTKKEAKKIKLDLIDLIKEVQNEVRGEFTFSFEFVGSSKRNMITCDYSQNKGFDFDVNLKVNDFEGEYSAKEIKLKLISAINKVVNSKSKQKKSNLLYYDNCEDSTRVITIKVKDKEKSKIVHSVDFCIVNYYENEEGELLEEYIRYNKKSETYTWVSQSKSFVGLKEKEKIIKQYKKWYEVREVYLKKKNSNKDINKHSRSLYAETINEVYIRLEVI